MRRKSRYSEEFKNQAVKRTMSGNYSIKEVAQSLGVSYDSLKKWRNDHMKKEEESTGGKEIDIKVLEEYKQLKKNYTVFMHPKLSVFKRGKFIRDLSSDVR